MFGYDCPLCLISFHVQSSMCMCHSMCPSVKERIISFQAVYIPCLLLTDHCSQITAYSSLLKDHCSLQTAHKSLLTAHCEQCYSLHLSFIVMMMNLFVGIVECEESECRKRKRKWRLEVGRSDRESNKMQIRLLVAKNCRLRCRCHTWQ